MEPTLNPLPQPAWSSPSISHAARPWVDCSVSNVDLNWWPSAHRCLNPDGRLIMLTARSAELQPPKEIAAILLGVVEKSKPWVNLVTLVTRWQQQQPSSSVRRIATAVERLDHLSPRESRVFQCLGKGMQNKEIAAVLGLCVNTVDIYRKVISTKLSLSGSELVRAAALHRCTHVADLTP